MSGREHLVADGPAMGVSVIIVSWNARSFLLQCLDSIFAQAFRCPMEVIVVDNASAAGSPEVVARQYPQVRLILNSSNLGFAKANNIGIQASSGKYICLINSDVKVLDGCITTLADYMEAHPAVGMAGPRMLDPDGTVGRSCRGFPTVWNMFCVALGLDSAFPHCRWFGGYSLRFWAQDTTETVDILGGWFWIIRRQALVAVGLLDEDFFFYAEDMDWCKRFHLQGLGVVFVSTAASVHYGGGSSRNAPINYAVQQQRANFQYVRKHNCKLEQIAYVCIAILHQTTRLLGHGLLLLLRPGNDQRSYKVQRSWGSLLWLLRGPA